MLQIRALWFELQAHIRVSTRRCSVPCAQEYQCHRCSILPCVLSLKKNRKEHNNVKAESKALCSRIHLLKAQQPKLRLRQCYSSSKACCLTDAGIYWGAHLRMQTLFWHPCCRSGLSQAPPASSLQAGKAMCWQILGCLKGLESGIHAHSKHTRSCLRWCCGYTHSTAFQCQRGSTSLTT